MIAKTLPKLFSSAYMYPGVQRVRTTEYDVIKETCAHYDVTYTEMMGKRRYRKYVWARHVAMYLIRSYFPQRSLQQIGNIFNKDHATVLHGIRVVRNLASVDIKLSSDLNELCMKINNKFIPEPIE